MHFSEYVRVLVPVVVEARFSEPALMPDIDVVAVHFSEFFPEMEPDVVAVHFSESVQEPDTAVVPVLHVQAFVPLVPQQVPLDDRLLAVVVHPDCFDSP